MTYEDLFELVHGGDPLVIPGCRVEMTDDGLVIHGYQDAGGFAPDLKIRVEGDQMRAWVRDLGNVEWCHEALFDRYEDLVVWAYEW